MTARRALITGITGQDGSYLAELLLDKGWEVHGLVRSSTADISQSRIGHILDEHRLHLHFGDVTDPGRIDHLVRTIEPEHAYNLAAQSYVATSFDQPGHTMRATGLGALYLLEAVRRGSPNTRVYQAGSSEMFGASPPPQNEETPLHPQSPYAVAKVMAHHTALNYRDGFGLFVANGILFNHESPRRGNQFVTKKIARTVARIARGLESVLPLGRLDARRDWGHARDYVRAMYLMLEHDVPDDFVIATGESHTVMDFAELAFAQVGLNATDFVVVDERLLRPLEPASLVGDASKAARELGWRPSISFEQLVTEMVELELRALDDA